VFAVGEQVATLQVVTFETPTYLHHVGKSLLEETDESGPPQPAPDARLVSGGLERSNVQIVLEMVRMIEANRAFEASAKSVTTQDEMGSRMFTSVGKPS
jgi:flagellar basal-body rod protein FlgG